MQPPVGQEESLRGREAVDPGGIKGVVLEAVTGSP